MTVDILEAKIFIFSFMLSGLSGFAALLRLEEPLTSVRILSAVLNSALLGLGLTLLWYMQMRENLYFLVGACVLAGLGGSQTLELILKTFRKRIGE